ncbi:MAG TPA: ATP-grasp domain-containing protein [Gaiellaceae bacterium]|nr:ATP-grasp domain-containing protein [Gaiellaceae bacterium]
MGSSSPSGRDGDLKRLLVLGAGPAQLGLHRAARERGLFVIACDRDPTAVGFEFVDRRAVVSVEDEAAISQLARAEQVDGIIAPGIDWPVAIAARIAAHNGLPHPVTPETAALTVLKHRQRKRLAEHGVPQPRWQVTNEVVEGLPLPAVVKPVDRQGQKGLAVVRDHDELRAAIAAAVEASRNGLALVEELVGGPEVTVNAFSLGGVFHPLTVTDRLTADAPAFGVALAHVWPSEHAVEEAVEAARLAADALGVTDGPTYTQIVLGPDGPRVMELAARLGGGHDAELCRVALRVDLNGLALAAALGEPLETPEPAPSGGAVVRFLVPPPGVLEDVAGLEEALAVDGVVDARVYRAPGWEFGPFRRGNDRAGYVLARGESREEALARADRAAELIRFRTAHALLEA